VVFPLIQIEPPLQGFNPIIGLLRLHGLLIGIFWLYRALVVAPVPHSCLSYGIHIETRELTITIGVSATQDERDFQPQSAAACFLSIDFSAILVRQEKGAEIQR